MSLVHIYGHHNSSKSGLTLTPVASLNVRLHTFSEFIMASFLRSSAPRTTIAVELSYPYMLKSVSICRAPFHSNISQDVFYKISKYQILQYWVDWKLTHVADWEGIDLTPFELARNRTTFHMSHFIKKCMSNTLSTMKIIQRQGNESNNISRAVVWSQKKYSICINTPMREVAADG